MPYVPLFFFACSKVFSTSFEQSGESEESIEGREMSIFHCSLLYYVLRL